jgi:histidine decarboxylase
MVRSTPTGPDSAVVAPDPARVSAAADRLRQLHDDLLRTADANVGFPGGRGIDYGPLARFLDPNLGLINQLGDPAEDGEYRQHVKPFERAVIAYFARLFHAAGPDAVRGYVTGGGSEATLHALWLARSVYPNGIVYYSAAAHSSVEKAINILAVRSVRVAADRCGEIDYEDLTLQLDARRSVPAIVVATAGAIMTEAVDDVRRITAILDQLAIDRRYIYVDAALAGIPLALVDPDERRGFDFADGADAIALSGHKFLGTPVSCAVALVKANHYSKLAARAAYTGSLDTTVSNSRSGLAVLALWYAIECYGSDGLQALAAACRRLAAYTHRRLRDLGWPAHRHRDALTITVPALPAAVTKRWAVATADGFSQIVCTPGTTRQDIDALLADLATVDQPAATADANLGRAA